MKKLTYLGVLFCTMFCTVIWAQTVTGIVTSDDGPLPGATILVKGKSAGTTSDFDGNFTITADANDVLVISYVGYQEQEVPVNDQDQIEELYYLVYSKGINAI